MWRLPADAAVSAQGRREQRDHDSHRAGKALFRNAALTVVNFTNQDGRVFPLDCTFYYRRKTGFDEYGPLVEDVSQSVAPGKSFRYAPDRFRVAALIRFVPTPQNSYNNVFVDVRNIALGHPRGGVNRGTDLRPLDHQTGDSLIGEQGWKQQESVSATIAGGGHLGFSRNDDSSDFIEFSVRLGLFPS
jgi:hypothetical protein